MTTFNSGSTFVANSPINNTINHHHHHGDVIPGASFFQRRPFPLGSSPSREQIFLALAQTTVENAEWGGPVHRGAPHCHPDTREAIVKSFKAWVNDPAGCPLQWINGWPGVGKTTLARTMAKFWAEEDRLAASFFFSKSSADTSTTNRFFETIAYQLLQSLPLSDGALRFLLPDQLEKHGWTNIVRALQTIPPSFPSMVIIIDGLDECTNLRSQVQLLRSILGSIKDICPSIKFLISCRPERHLQKVFEDTKFNLGNSYRTHLGQSPEDNEDVQKFLQYSFDRICQHCRKHGTMSIKDGLWPSKEKMEQLVKKASGQFVYAETVVAFVNDDNQDPVKLLDLILDPDQTSSFPALDKLYLTVLNKAEEQIRLYRQDLLQSMHDLLLHIHYWPSSPSSIADFWFMNEVDVNILIGHLQGILRRPDRPGDPILFHHQSFRDFLRSPSSPHSFSLDEMKPISTMFFHLRLTMTTLRRKSIMPISLSKAKWLMKLLFDSSKQQTNGNNNADGSDVRLSIRFSAFSVFLACFLVWPYDDRARKLHYAYIQEGRDFDGCECCSQLQHVVAGASLVTSFGSCDSDDCILKSAKNLQALCQIIGLWVKYSRIVFSLHMEGNNWKCRHVEIKMILMPITWASKYVTHLAAWDSIRLVAGIILWYFTVYRNNRLRMPIDILLAFVIFLYWKIVVFMFLLFVIVFVAFWVLSLVFEELRVRTNSV
ncbi:hypothetical protein BDN72DRAFT_847361 [Pluteus cervinus]|uniref:Uncharacterized protein n=1 Tax=Pluteus cervinus TaxID=181527 RepID=A0ACD3AD82_9AGAR|nr:hypothetical protein BDN72DRAFT_847361 [Pluteus cervinus]